MFINILKCLPVASALRYSLLISYVCRAQYSYDDFADSDLLNDDKIVLHNFPDDDSWTMSPDSLRNNSMPLPMAIWISLVLGIFVFMAIAVCCGLFCKYSGKLQSSSPQEIPSPIPIFITPPTRTDTQLSLQAGFANQGYQEEPGRSNSQDSPTSDGPPVYFEVISSAPGSPTRFVLGKKLETPPPTYMMVAPFK